MVQAQKQRKAQSGRRSSLRERKGKHVFIILLLDSDVESHCQESTEMLIQYSIKTDKTLTVRIQLLMDQETAYFPFGN